MGKVLRKLQSNNGATLMLALLFFIVCAVTGSMILVSATASSGRLEGMSKQDQNYYAVSSAARFLEKTLCSEDTYIQATDKLEITKGTKPDPDDPEKEIEYTIYDYDPPKLYIMDGTTDPPTKIEELTSGILFDLLTDDEITYYKEKSEANSDPIEDDYPSEFTYKWFKGGENSEFNGEFPDDKPDLIKKTILTVSSNSSEIDSLKVDVSIYLDKTGILLIKCKNHVEQSSEPEEDNGNTYSMLIKMECEKIIKKKETGSAKHLTKTRFYGFKFNTISIAKSK